MTHDNAIESMAAERYILGELDPSERDAFEEHYFECTACADEVRDSAKFAAGVRTSGAKVRFNWWAVAASIFAATLGYQNLVVMPQMAQKHDSHTQSARVLVGQQLNPESRGSSGTVSGTVIYAAPDEPLRLDVPFVATTPGPHRGEIRDAHGRQFGEAFDMPDTSDAVPLFVPAGTLHSGNYTLVIRGAGGREDTTFGFEVRSR